MDNQFIGDSHTRYPQMMQNTRLLIIDYDTFRYTSFDLFRYLLTDRQMFETCDPKMRSLVLHQDFPRQVCRYERGCPHFSPYECFAGHADITLDEYEERLCAQLPKLKTTPTDLCDRFGVVFERHTITGYLLRYTEDTFKLPFDRLVTTYRSHRILDLNKACDIVKKHQINAVMVSSVDLAVVLTAKLQSAGVTSPMSFVIGSYAYNMEPGTGMLRLVPEMLAYEQKFRHEYGMYEPFTNLTAMKEDGIDE